MKLLCIISTPKPADESYGKQMAYTFLDEYKKKNPDHKIDIIDLYEDDYPTLKYLEIENARNEGTGKMIEEAEKFKEYDKYVVVAPMWNLSVPSILKSYIDHIIVSGVTFKYTKYGIPKGLLKGKKAFYIGTRGGAYPFPASLIAFDMKYIKYVFRFMGIKKFNSFLLEDIDKKPEKTKINFSKKLGKLKICAKKF